MEQAMTTCMITALGKLARGVDYIYRKAQTYWYPPLDSTHPHARYFLSDSRPVIGKSVPDDAIYVEEWVENGTKRCVVRYGGEEIPSSWSSSPFAKHARTPWVWVGDRDTEIDLTRTFNRYLVVGNKITQELVKKLIQVTEKTNLIYIESGTFKELKFPGDGLVIQEYDDGPVQNSG